MRHLIYIEVQYEANGKKSVVTIFVIDSDLYRVKNFFHVHLELQIVPKLSAAF
ncbi:hypothetical protein B0G57_105160 [Trinickia symbiotica]|nr:hypothetical protein B0G57_105160 [Trinickia symbiotica]